MAYSVPDKPYNSWEQRPLNLEGYIGEITDRARKSWGREDETYEWAKEQDKKNQATADTINARALDTMYDFNQYAKRDQDMYAQQYMPAMQQQLDFAKGYTTPERMAANRAGAGAGGALQFQKTREASERALQGIGVNPAAGRSTALTAGIDAADAANRAALMTTSDRQTEAMGQEYLDRAIKTGAVLPGQAVNEASMALASGNQALNAPLAATASGLAGRTNTAWEQVGTGQMGEVPKAKQAEVEADFAGRRITNEGIRNNLEAQKQQDASSEGSGIGAAIGGGLGILGTVAGAYFGGPMGASLGGSLGSSLGSAAGGSGGITRTGRSGFGLAATGGKVKKNFSFRAGGMVGEQEEREFAPPRQMGARPRLGREVDPVNRDPGEAREWREPLDTSEWDAETPDSDTGYADEQEWVPNYDTGGLIDAFADGGEVDPEGNVYPPEMDEEMMEGGTGAPEEEMAEGEMPGGNMVPPEASPSGGEEVDDVHAMVSEGEFVMPKDVTSWFGEKFMQNLINKARKEMSEPKAEGQPGPPMQAMALSPPSFQSEGAGMGA